MPTICRHGATLVSGQGPTLGVKGDDHGSGFGCCQLSRAQPFIVRQKAQAGWVCHKGVPTKTGSMWSKAGQHNKAHNDFALQLQHLWPVGAIVAHKQALQGVCHWQVRGHSGVLHTAGQLCRQQSTGLKYVHMHNLQGLQHMPRHLRAAHQSTPSTYKSNKVGLCPQRARQAKASSPPRGGSPAAKSVELTSWGFLLPCAALRLEELADCLQRLLQGGVPRVAVAAARCLCLQAADHPRAVYGYMYLNSLIV